MPLSSAGWKYRCTVPEKLRVAREVLRGAEQHRRVAVVAARVHLAVRAARIRQAGLLDDRQRVHVGANADAARAVAHLQRAHHAGLTDPARDLPAPLFELLGHQRAGLHFLVGQFRVMMDVMADLAQALGGRRQVGHFSKTRGFAHLSLHGNSGRINAANRQAL